MALGRSALARAIRRQRYRPRIRTLTGYPLRRLGTGYGGWTFVDTPELTGCTAICCGLGEDASFDIAFATRFGATVICVDPTPRAIEHFDSIRRRFGSPASEDQTDGGRLAPASYELSGIDETRYLMIPKAVAGTAGRLKFFAPANPDHVSYSLVNFQNHYSNETASIEVEAVTLSSILAEYPDAALVKLDIEGAEAAVIPELLEAGFRPQQILAEFDEMNVPSKRSRASAETTDAFLRLHGYECVFHDGRSTYSYLRLT